ncbi:MAG TPA: DUF3857 domain-containing protein [Kofleriaceae bacterium]
MRRRWTAPVVLIVVALADLAHATPALDKPAFTATPQELLAAAKAAPNPGGDVVILRDDTDVSYDDRGRATFTWRLVFLVTSKAGADNWDVLRGSWVPAYQDKPKVRARVIDASGRVVDLDQSLIKDEPANDAAQAVPTDRRNFEAPLPRLAIGSIVEEQLTTIDREPLLGGGAAQSVDISGANPVHSGRITFSSPKKLRMLAYGVPVGVKPKTQTVGGKQVTTYTFAAVPARPEYEGFIPGDARPFPAVVATPVASWNAIAREYRSLVDKKLAEGPVTFPAEIKKAATLDTMRELQAWLNKQVQFTAVPFDDAAVTPSTPAEILKRGNAGARDMATLMLALLRQAGLRASLVLINTGPGRDLDRDIPAMNMFDHVLVRVQLGKTDVWIDPTTRATPPGRLPWYDQGRFGLVISDDANALITTPATSSADNVIREVRTFDLAESGGAKVTEVSREGGIFDADQRLWIRDTPADALRKNLTDYAIREYRATLVSHTATAADDLTKPFEVTVVAKDAARAYTNRETIDIYLFRTDLLDKLPDPLGDAKPDEPMRKYDLKLSSPHVYEIENRLVVPVGFTMPTPAPDKTRELGTLRLVEKQRVDGRAFVVTYRLDTGKARITPAEVQKVQKAIRDLRQEDAEHLVIHHTAHALADSGKYRDAIAEVNKLIQLHPKEALHQQQLAHVLIKAGAGEPARRAARKATELEPKNADAHVVLGWVLNHDTFGKWLGFDHDRAGARVALEKARKLDPKHVGAVSDHASLLERNARGRRFDTGSDVRAAIEAWRAAVALDSDDEDHKYGLANALLWAGDGAEAEKVLRGMTVAERRDQLLITASAVASGGEAALRTASSLASGATRTKYVTGAGGVLFLLRRYDLMRVMFADAKALQGGGTAQEQAMQRITRHDKPFKPSKTPQDTVVEMVLVELHSDRASNPYWDKATRDEVRGQQKNVAMTLLANDLMTTGLLEDLMRSALQLTVEGDAGLWRVEFDQGKAKSQVYIAADRGTPKVIAASEVTAGAGRHVLRLLAKKDEKGAQRLLDWLATDLVSRRRQDVDATRFLSLWGANLPRTRSAMEVAAAALAGKSDATRAIPLLTACKPSTKEGQFACDWALSDLYRDSGKWMEQRDHTKEWLTRATTAPVLPTVAHAYALAHLDAFDDADKLIGDALVKDPANEMLVFTHSDVAVARGQLAEAIRRLDPVVKRPSPGHGELNNVAWLKLVEGTDVKGSVMLARKAVQLAPKHPNAANTLAAIQAELGELHDAKQFLDISVDANNRLKPGSADVYVHARMLEQLGYVDDAIAHYRQVKAGPPGVGFAPDADELAKRRLKALGVKP